MARKKAWVMLLVCLLFAVLLAGCNDAADAADLDPDALLGEVAQKLGGVKSSSVQVSAVVDVTVPGDKGKPVRTSADIDITALSIENRKFKLDFGMTARADGETADCDIVMYLVEENGQMKAYYSVSATPPSAGEAIIKGMPFKNGESLGPVQDAGPAASHAAPENYLANPRIAGTESIDGREAVRLQTELDLKKIMDEVEESLGKDVSADDLATARVMLMMLGDIDVDIWADAVTHDPVRLEIDFKNQLDALTGALEPLMEGDDAGVSINSLSLKITVSELDAVPDFEVPVGLKATEGTKTSA
ncbi:MAG: hypothetical protein ACOX8O_02255 [Christensenellales bacterium]